MIRILREGLSTRWRLARTWIRDGKPLWVWLVVAAIALILPYFLGPTQLSDQVRWSGMLFQFLGLATVVWGLNISRQLFGRPSMWKAVVQWIGRLRYIIEPLKPVSVTGHAQAGAAAVAGFASAVRLSPTASIERRVAKLEDDLRQAEKRISETSRDVVNLRKEIDRQIQTERNERQAGDRKVSMQVEEATIGGIHLEVAGLAYLYVGILFTSVPHETAKLLQKIGV